MSEEEFGWVTGDAKIGGAEEDLRWCANVALAASAVLVIGGVVFSKFSETPSVQCYVIATSIILGAAFFLVGAVIHWRVHEKIQRTTIKRPEGWGK